MYPNLPLFPASSHAMLTEISLVFPEKGTFLSVLSQHVTQRGQSFSLISDTSKERDAVRSWKKLLTDAAITKEYKEVCLLPNLNIQMKACGNVFAWIRRDEHQAITNMGLDVPHTHTEHKAFKDSDLCTDALLRFQVSHSDFRWEEIINDTSSCQFSTRRQQPPRRWSMVSDEPG